MVARSFLAFMLAIVGCAGAVQRESQDATPIHPGGRVVGLTDVQGKHEKILSVRLYFYPGEFEIPLEPGGGGVWRGDLTREQVSGMVRLRQGFRVYRCRLTIVSESAAGERDSKTQDLTIALEPGP